MPDLQIIGPLSTERANSIVRVLRDSYDVDPTRLLAGGRSKYNPVADNGTKEGRAIEPPDPDCPES